jgi:predicted Zn-dependent protease
VRPSDTPRSLAGILAHELGHAIDVSHFDTDDRERWLEARGVEGAQWWPDAYASDFETGAGDFAEAFAYWALRDVNSSKLAGTPNSAQLETMADLVSRHL